MCLIQCIIPKIDKTGKNAIAKDGHFGQNESVTDGV